MKLNKSLLFVASLLALGAQGVRAEEAKAPAGASLQTMAESAKMYFEYNFKLLHNDHGMNKVDGGDDPTQTNELTGSTFKLKTALKAAEKVDFDFAFNFLSQKEVYSGLETAKVTLWLMPNLGVTMGKDKTHVGGFENYVNSSFRIFDSKYYETKPFSTYARTASIQYKAAGTVSIQFVNDYKPDANSPREWSERPENAKEQPAMILEWKGDLGAVQPLVAYAGYDNNHSTYLSLGVLYHEGPVTAFFDFIQDQRARAESDTSSKEKIDTYTNINLQAQYDLGTIEPFFKFSSFNVKDADTDVKINSALDTWDDNAMQWGIGTYFLKQGTFARPYISIVGESGKFAKSDTDATEETKSNMIMTLGIDGTI